MGRGKGLLKKEIKSRYKERSNIPDYDWSINELTADGEYHELNCKPISQTATYIVLSIEALSVQTRYIRLREPNETYEITYLRVSSHENYFIEKSVLINCNDDGKIEYWLTNKFWPYLKFTIIGWFEDKNN